ncbi:MAG: hypothetical protein Kow0027_05220 [Saprospiraceae bacterium]
MTEQQLFNHARKQLTAQGFNVVSSDEERPWGGFFVIDESQASHFIEAYFPTLSPADFSGFGKLSPKILLVKPGKRLSWQYHHRRSEIWRVLQGPVGVVKSPDDTEGPMLEVAEGDIVKMEKGERHRLVGLDNWGVLAEIWQHTDPLNPSNEDDIVRVQDDFGRQN